MLFPHRHWTSSRPAPAPMRSTPLRLLAVVGCAVVSYGAMALPRSSAAWGQTVASATVTEVLDSNQVFIQNRRAAVNSVAQRRHRVRTQAARTSLRFDNGAVARLAHNSSLTIGQCAQLNRGTLLVNGSLNGCSTTTMAGVRGTLYTLEVNEAGETVIQVFEGEVMVNHRTGGGYPEILEENYEYGPSDYGPGDGGSDGGSEGGSEGGSGVSYKRGSDAGDSPGDHVSDRQGLGGSRLGEQVLDPWGGDTPTPDAMALLTAFAWKQTTDPRIKSNPTDPATETTPSPSVGGGDPVPPPTTETTETVELTPDTTLIIREGQQVNVNADGDEAMVTTLTIEDFIELMEGPLIYGFATPLPGLSDLQGVFQRLFPGIPLPTGLSTINIPLPPMYFPF